jgi:hypothetical protein
MIDEEILDARIAELVSAVAAAAPPGPALEDAEMVALRPLGAGGRRRGRWGSMAVAAVVVAVVGTVGAAAWRVVSSDEPIAVNATVTSAGDSQSGQVMEPDVPVDPVTSEALSDGEVTFDEYEQAVLRTIVCAKDQGLIVEDLVLSRGTYLYGYYDDLDTETVNHSAPIHERCYQRSLEPLELPYAEQAGLLDRVQMADETDLVACLDAVGSGQRFDVAGGVGPILDLLSDLSDEFTPSVLERLEECVDLHAPGRDPG